MTCRSAVHACIALTLIIAPCLAQTGGAVVGVAPQTERVLTGQFAGKIGTETRAVFGFGPIAYTVAEKHRYLADDPTVYEMGEGYIGMPAPSSANWYHTGFLFVRVNGHDVQIPATSVMAVESGHRAILDMVWHDPDALVRTRFFGLPGENWLGCEVKVEPINEITSLTIALRCYPSFFTSAYNRDGARRIQTPSLLVEEGAAAEGALAENPWAFYYDEVFDVARGEGDGPCAMLALPVDGATIRYEPGSYAVNTTLYFPPDTRTIGFAFWDYKGLTNADALADLQGQADTVLATLETADLTPKAVAEFDIAAVRASLEEALASAETREALGERIGEVEAWLAANEQMEQPGAVVGVAGQEELLGSLDDYNSFQWEVKLIKLLNDL
jgi:hypothetical protein